MHGNMKAAMEELNFYRLTDGALSAGEIAAYEAAVALIDSRIAETLQELFPETAEGYGLSLWEEALGLRAVDGTAFRRNKIIEKESQEPGNFEGYIFQRQFDEICPGGSLATSGGKVVITGANRNNMEELGGIAALILPNLSPLAALALQGVGQSWNAWESRFDNWNFYDRTAIPWDFYDTI